MAFDKGQYDIEYAKKNITRKFIPFNKAVKTDVDILNWLNQQDNVTQYIKSLILADMTAIRSQNGSQTGE
jgi:hypothetical protein